MATANGWVAGAGLVIGLQIKVSLLSVSLSCLICCVVFRKTIIALLINHKTK